MQQVKSILSDLKKKNYHPIYFLYGTEPLYIDKITSFIEKNVLSDSEKSFNQTVVYGRDVEASSIIEICTRLPMMASHQVVIVKEAQEIKGFEKLESYFKNPLSSTIFVMAYKHKKVDKRKTIFKSILKSENVVSFESNAIKEYEIVRWISEYVQSNNIDIDSKGVQVLAEFLGTDLSKITHEIDKLILIKGEGNKITVEDIEKNIGISKDYNIFELNNALGRRDSLKSFRIVKYFESNPKSLFLPMAIGTIYGFYSKILLSKYASSNDLPRLLRLPPFIAKDYAKYASMYNINQIKNIFGLLRDADLKSKGMGSTGTVSHGETLKELVAKILI